MMRLLNMQGCEMQERIKEIIALVSAGKKDIALEELYVLSEDVDKVRILANSKGPICARWAWDLEKKWGGKGGKVA